PPAAAYDQARDLLQHLGALANDGTITEHGRRMSGLGLHPRLAHMLLCAEEVDAVGLACDIAALLSERDIFKARSGVDNADLRLRVQALRDLRGRGRAEFDYARGFQVDRGAAHHVLRVAKHWRRKVHTRKEDADVDLCGLLTAFAYPDRIAQKINGRFRLRNGRMATFGEPQLLSNAEYLVAADLGERRRESRIFRAAPVGLEDLFAHFDEQIEEVDTIAWDDGVVRARRRLQLGAVVLKDGPIADPDPDRMVDALIEGIREEGLELLPWTKNARHLQERLVFLGRHEEEWPGATNEALLENLEDWLRPHLYGMKRAEDLQQLDVTNILLGYVGWDRREELDERAPTHVTVPSGSRIPIDYSDPDAPVLAVRLQELFGQTETPRIDRGRVRLTLHLLSPAHRPMQVTQDLANFWKDTYFDVRKDLRGRYPKHYWPEDPLRAEPTNRAKPRKG
ncbi:MAG: ATP-dependent helicase C-terminal domain-containing protein, partial [Rhodothermales bacterium]